MSLEFSEKELEAIKSEYCAGATDAQFELFISECKARSLRPGPHLVFQLRSAKVYDPDTNSSRFVKRPYWITTIGALRLIALRTGQYDGSSSPDYIYLDEKGDPTVVSQIPLPDKNNKSLPREPWAVRVSVRRKDFSEPITSIVRFDSVAATRKRDNTLVLTDMWVKRGDAQNAKCCEADALRKAFPEELGSLYLSEEIKNEVEEHTPAAVTPASVVPVPPSAPKVNQQPAVATETPRPGETKAEYHVIEVPATLPEHSGDTLKVITKEQVETMDKLLQNPAIQQKLAEEGKKINQEAIDQLKKDVGLKPASELPAPKKKGGRPKKENPNNGHVPGEITDADFENMGKPAPEPIDKVANQKEAEKFVEDLDPTPTKEEQAGFTARVRALAAAGAQNQDLKNYILNVGKKDDPKAAYCSQLEQGPRRTRSYSGREQG